MQCFCVAMPTIDHHSLSTISNEQSINSKDNKYAVITSIIGTINSSNGQTGMRVPSEDCMGISNVERRQMRNVNCICLFSGHIDVTDGV